VNSARGRQLQPVEVFEVTPWRALALFRVTTLVYAILMTALNIDAYPHQWAAWLVSAVMVAWSGLATIGYERPHMRTWALLIGDLDITAGCLLSSIPVIGPSLLSQGRPTLTLTWMACPVLAVAIIKGIRWGIFAAVLIGACDLTVHGVTAITQTALTGTVIMVMAAAALGYLANIGIRAQEQLRLMAAGEAVHAERERLARTIHDSVLQVLALVKRRGEELGGEAAELGRLAGEQELALRTLIGSSGAVDPGPTGMVDLREMIGSLATARVTVSAPATGMWLPAQTAREILAAVGEASENAHQHCPPETKVWILLEDEKGTITATIRDDGPGIPTGRLEQAAAQGRLGVAKSIRGRIADLGGRVAITSAPGEGTEVELSVRRKELAG
jgi:signal transduction histidine kinase